MAPRLTLPGRRQDQQQIAALTEAVHQSGNTIELLQESIADLQLAMEDVGWQKIIAASRIEFERRGLATISDVCRIYALKNPLIKRGLVLRRVYVWGQGVEVSARANGRRNRPGEQDVNAVLQQFRDDPATRNVLSGAAAQARNETALFTDGNLFVALFTKPKTGRVQPRLVPWEEIEDVITNPEDRAEVWFYRRRWVETAYNADGHPQQTTHLAYYPAVNYRPSRGRPKSIGGYDVRWDSPIKHVKVNDQVGWKFGLGDAYPAIDWAKAYKEFLEDWAKLVKALSRFAWRATTPGNKAAALRAKIAETPTRNATGELNTAGATALLPPDVSLEAIPKTGATIDSESSRPLAMMVAAALGVPVTMLLADPGQTGARATAETLDQPTELEMAERRQMWSEVERDIAEYVIRESVRAPQGKLRGIITRDEYDREVVTLAGDTEQTIDIAWPDLKDLDPAGIVAAIVQANSTGTIPPERVLRLLLAALGIRNVDEIVDELVDEDGNFQWPNAPPLSDGQAAAAAARAGGDPADAGAGPMAPPDTQPATSQGEG